MNEVSLTDLLVQKNFLGIKEAIKEAPQTLEEYWALLDAYLGLGELIKAEDLLREWGPELRSPDEWGRWCYYKGLVLEARKDVAAAARAFSAAKIVLGKGKDRELQKLVEVKHLNYQT